MKSTLVRWGAVALMIGALAACGGGGGGGDTTAAAPPAPVTPPVTTPDVAVPTGTAPVTVTSLTATQWAALTPVVTIGTVAISSPPKVTFAIADGAATNNPVVGIGLTTQTATATLPSLAHLRFSLAKLVPGANGSPSKWVNYIVTTVPTYKSDTDKTIVNPAPTRPTTDQQGTLVDNKNGTYTYTFYRDIPKIKDQVAAMTVTAPNALADLGDLTYDPNLPHRLTIQLSGNARGTGTNTADGSNSGVTAVPIANPVNAIYDFIPATGKAIAAADLTREVVAVANCNECHEKLTLHGSRNQTKYCVVCHTDQLKYGFANVASTAGKFPAIKETVTVSATTGITSYTYSGSMFLADGESLGNFPILVHKIHQGKDLVKENYNMANVAFNNKGFSMLGGGQKMCAKCHDNTKALQADNWNTKPSRVACGACHDGINFATGGGSTLADKAAATAVGAVLATSGHVGKAQSSDATCALCHGPTEIKTYHQTENVTPHNPTVAAGLTNFSYDIKSAAVDATSNDVSIVFRILASTDGSTPAPVKFAAAAAGGVSNPLSGFTSAPGFLLAYTMTQDGITTPADYNNAGIKQAQAISVGIAKSSTFSGLLDTASTVGSLSATADADGYYTATLKGNGPTSCGGTTTPVKCVFPVGAKMRAVALQSYFTQVSPAAARHAISVVKTVTGDTARRTVVDKEKCSNCHEWFEGHGGSRVKETQVCVMCHVPGLASSARGISDATLGAYTFNAADTKILKDWGFDRTLASAALKFPVTTNAFKNLIHGIHSGRDRVTPFVDARDRTPSAITLLDFKRMDFPGVLNNCGTCHVAGTYSSVPLTALASTYESIDAAYAAAITAGTATPAIAKTALNTANSNDKVTSPFAGACISCHDSPGAQGHVATNGGMIMVDRSTFVTNIVTPGKGEACATCHGVGRAEDITVVHKQ